MPESFQNYVAIPSAVIANGPVAVPLFAVTSLSLSETYHLPPIGSSSAKAIVATHDDTVSLSGVLVGPERFAWKLALETLADASKRGPTGLTLITSMTIRTEMQIQSLSFTASSGRRDVIDVSVSLAHMPSPGALGKLLDAGALGVAAMTDWIES
jgi:hypothetical protein